MTLLVMICCRLAEEQRILPDEEREALLCQLEENLRMDFNDPEASIDDDGRDGEVCGFVTVDVPLHFVATSEMLDAFLRRYIREKAPYVELVGVHPDLEFPGEN